MFAFNTINKTIINMNVIKRSGVSFDYEKVS